MCSIASLPRARYKGDSQRTANRKRCITVDRSLEKRDDDSYTHWSNFLSRWKINIGTCVICARIFSHLWYQWLVNEAVVVVKFIATTVVRGQGSRGHLVIETSLSRSSISISTYWLEYTNAEPSHSWDLSSSWISVVGNDITVRECHSRIQVCIEQQWCPVVCGETLLCVLNNNNIQAL